MTTPVPPLPVPDDDGLDAAASAVAEAVGSPVGAQDPQAAAAGLAAALAAFDGGAAQVDDEAGTAPDGTGSPVPAGAQVTRLRPSPRSGSGRGLSRLAAVAAALVLVVGLGALSVALLRSGGDDDAATSTALGSDAEREAVSPSGLTEGAGQGAAGDAARQQQPSPAPGIGSGSGAVQTGAPPQASTAQAADPRALAAERPPPVVDGGDLGRQVDVAAVAQRTGATLDGVADPAFTAPGAAPPRDVQACIATGAATAGEPLGPLRYRAVGTFEGKDAVFLAFDRTGANPPRLLLVLARSGCAVLASTHF